MEVEVDVDALFSGKEADRYLQPNDLINVGVKAPATTAPAATRPATTPAASQIIGEYDAIPPVHR